MKFIIAPNAFKGSLSANEAAEAIEKGIKTELPNAIMTKLLIADGGDGFVSALQAGLSAAVHTTIVSGPMCEKNPSAQVKASFLFSAKEKIAIIEMAEAAGLALIDPKKLDPMNASTKGVGELLIAALDLGAKHIIIGIGGSATSDGGTGMATALGIRFLDKNNHALSGNAKNLNEISRIDCSQIDKRLKSVTIDVACDVNNLLLGKQGAARIYSPQKGANENQVIAIEKGLQNLSRCIKKDLNKNVEKLIGGGAAGGLGAGLSAFFNAKLTPGTELLLDIVGFDEKATSCDLLITTEGKLDQQTGFGKAPTIVAQRAAKLGVPAIIIAGQIEHGILDKEQAEDNWEAMGFLRVYSLCDEKIKPDFAIAHAAQLLTKKTQQAINEFLAKK